MARANRKAAEGQVRELNLGERLRSLRAQRGWSLAEVANRSNIATSTLSRVENNQLSLTYEKLLQLSKGFGIDLSDLLSNEEEQARPATGRRAYTAPGEGRGVEVEHYHYQYLCTDLAQKKMTPIRGIITATSLAEAGGFLRHEGEEFIYVLKGMLEFHTEYYKPLQVAAGGSVYIDSKMGHAFVAAGGEPVHILSVCSLPEDELRSFTGDQRGPREGG